MDTSHLKTCWRTSTDVEAPQGFSILWELLLLGQRPLCFLGQPRSVGLNPTDCIKGFLNGTSEILGIVRKLRVTSDQGGDFFDVEA